MNTTSNGYASPSAFVSKGKQRLKQYNDTVYLNNGDEFEIELYNPTLSKVLAKIELNGNSIGNGIILRPGERVYLERYLDVAKKFLFETYNVEGSNNEVQKAIVNNGSVQVNFYNENIGTTYFGGSLILNGSSGTYYNSNHAYGLNTTTIGTGNLSTYTSDINGNVSTFMSNSTLTSGLGNLPFTGTLNDGKKTLSKKSLSTNDSIETGRIEKGSESKQNFTYDNSNFYSWASSTSKWKILPLSQKLLEKEDIKIFCTECGSKRKKDSHRYCPNCGTKY